MKSKSNYKHKGLDTVFGDVVYRSKAEAFWACFLTEVDVRFEYEPRKFSLNNHNGYIPDFWLNDQKIWVEIKNSDMITEDEKAKSNGLFEIDDHEVFTINGLPTINSFHSPFATKEDPKYTEEISGFGICLSNKDYKCEPFVIDLSSSVTMAFMLGMLPDSKTYSESEYQKFSYKFCSAARFSSEYFDLKLIGDIIVEGSYRESDSFIKNRSRDSFFKSDI